MWHSRWFPSRSRISVEPKQLEHLRDKFVEAKNSSLSHSVFVNLAHCSANAYCNCVGKNLELHVVLVQHCVYNVNNWFKIVCCSSFSCLTRMDKNAFGPKLLTARVHDGMLCQLNIGLMTATI